MPFQGEKPIFLQLAEQLEEGILSGAYPEGSQVPSITEYAPLSKRLRRLDSLESTQ